jgi:ssDNA-binding Zn-finger/Zn-ribbon topoisomerase 1
MPITGKGKYQCEYCGASLVIEDYFVQEKDTEYSLTCPQCKHTLGSFITKKNRHLFVKEAPHN